MKKHKKTTAADLITRPEIAKLTGVGLSKANAACHSKHRGFPSPCGKVGRKLGYSKRAVMAWLKNNDLKNMTFTPDEYACRRQPVSQASPKLDDALALQFITRANSKKHQAKTTGAKTTVVHLIERNDYIPPSRHTAWPSSNEINYILSLPGVR